MGNHRVDLVFKQSIPIEKVKILNFNGIHMNNEIFENLMAVITLFSEVKELKLNDTGICKKNFEYVVDLCYRGLPNLKSLFIQCILLHNFIL